MDANTIVVLEGDETGQELLEEALRVLDPGVIGLSLEFEQYDLSLESRRATDNRVVYDAAHAVRDRGLGLKAATVTPEQAGDVGSPNRILREEIGGRVIVRTGRRIPGIAPLGGVHAPISVVRMAVGDAYGAKEWREGEGEDEVAFRTERIERRICRSVAEFAFRLAERTGARVFGGPKYTVSPIYEGMLKEEMDAAAERHPLVAYQPQLIDATFALLLVRERRPAGDPGAEPRRRHPVRPRAAVVRIDRRLGVADRRLRRGLRSDGRAGGGRARHRAVAAGKERREPDGDDPRRGGAALLPAGRRAGLARDPRVVPRVGRRRHPHRRPRRPLRDDGVHGRGHPPRPPEARDLVHAVPQVTQGEQLCRRNLGQGAPVHGRPSGRSRIVGRTVGGQPSTRGDGRIGASSWSSQPAGRRRADAVQRRGGVAAIGPVAGTVADVANLVRVGRCRACAGAPR